MKKIYTLAIALIGTFAFGQNVVITTVVDGTLSALGCEATTGGSSSPKIIELYVSGTVDFNGYRLQTESNGAADESAISWSSGANISSLGSITDSFVYLVYAQNAETDIIFNEMYPSITSNLIKSSSMPNGNGNDAYRLVDSNDAVIDQYGNPLDVSGTNDYSAVWAYQDGYGKRNNGIGPNGGNFDPSTFTYGNGAFVAPNNTCDAIIDTIQLGTYTANASIKDNNIAGLNIYPNPATGNTLYIISHNSVEKTVAVFDVLGKQVINTTTVNGTVNITNLNAGVYIVKVTEEGKTATRKLVVK